MPRLLTQSWIKAQAAFDNEASSCQALGFRTDFELLRDGHAYAVLHGGIEVQVSEPTGGLCSQGPAALMRQLCMPV